MSEVQRMLHREKMQEFKEEVEEVDIVEMETWEGEGGAVPLYEDDDDAGCSGAREEE